MASGKYQDLKVLVSDCAPSRLTLNMSHSDLQRDDVDEAYYDNNMAPTLQQHNIHFSEFPSVSFTFLKHRNIFTMNKFEIVKFFMLTQNSVIGVILRTSLFSIHISYL